MRIDQYQGQYPQISEFQRPWEHLYVPQGLWKRTDSRSAQSLVAEGFSHCYGVVVRSRQQVIMVHAEPLLSSETFFSCQAALLRGGNEWQALIFKGTQSAPHTDCEELLTSVGAVIKRIILLDTGNLHWGLAYRCQEHLFLVNQSVNKTLITFSGF